MSKNHPHDNIYSILGKLDALTPKEAPKATAPTLKEYASVPAKGSILEGVQTIEQTLTEKYMGFKKLEKSIAATGDVKDAGAVAAAIGREKYGKKAFQKAAAAGKKMNEETCMECGMYESECGCDHTNESVDKESLVKAYQELYPKVAYNKKGEHVMEPEDAHDETCYRLGVDPSDMDDLLDEGQTTHKDGVTKHTKTDYPGYPSNDLEKDDDSDAPKSKGGKGRPRKAQTKNPRRDPNAPKKAKGRPSKHSTGEKSSSDNLPFSSKNAVGHDPFGRVHKDTHTKHKPKAKKVDEKAVSQAQQRFMGMAHAMQKGEKIKGASPELKKVARTMKPKATHDYAATKHKGLPQHVAESVNFKRMMEEQHMTLDEMISAMQEDMLHFKKTGICSDRLRDMLEVYSHAKKQMADESAPYVPGGNKGGIAGNVPGVQKPVQPAPQGVVGKAVDTAKQFGKWLSGKGGPGQEGPTYEEADPMEAELNELAKLAGLGEVSRGEYIKQQDAKAEHSGKKEFNAFGQLFHRDEVKEDPEAEFEGAGPMHYAKEKAKQAGKDTFKLGDEEFPVQEGEYGDAEVDEPTEADKPTNRPKKKYFSMKASTMNPGEGDSGEKRMYPAHPLGDNGMTKPARGMPVDGHMAESINTLEDRLAAEYESIKKVN